METETAKAHQDLEFLTSPAAAGRLSATPGAAAAADYLARRLEQIGLQPAGADGYLAPVQVAAARLTGPVRLAVGGHRWRHRLDFAEAAAISAGGTVSGPLLVVEDGPGVDPAALPGSVVLIPRRPVGFDLAGTAAAAAQLGARALLVESGEPGWFYKTVFSGQSAGLPVLRLRTAVATALLPHAGEQVQVELPLEATARTCHNVLGVLPGARDAPAVVLTAHYDHVGDDPGGYRFPGAWDNASGVAAVLAAAARLARSNLPVSLHVALLTGEESGLWGARSLLDGFRSAPGAVINVDAVGMEPETGAMRLGHPAAGEWLPDLAAQILTENGFTPRWVTGRDDASAFVRAGVPTVGLGQQPTGVRQIPLHTPDDTLSALYPEQVDRVAELVAELVRRTVAVLSVPVSPGL